jgi:hypothetical protein
MTRESVLQHLHQQNLGTDRMQSGRFLLPTLKKNIRICVGHLHVAPISFVFPCKLILKAYPERALVFSASFRFRSSISFEKT